MLKQYDVITLGSNTIDVYVYTKKGMYHLLRRKNQQELAFDLGSKIEVDKIRFSTGGSGTNTAVCLRRLGLNVAYLGKLGNDENRKLVLDMLKKERVQFLGTKDKKHMTGYSVILDAIGHDRTVLAYKGANDHLKLKDIALKKINSKWVYLGSMLGESFNTVKRLIPILKKKGIKIMFNPSSYQAKWGVKKLAVLLQNSEMLVMNKEEARDLLNTRTTNIEYLLKKLHKINQGMVLITDGSRPAHCFEGKHMYTAYPRKVRIKETTGAGDAFASSFLAGTIIKNDIIFALKLGLLNSESVITHMGAKEKLLTKKEIYAKLKKTKLKITKKRQYAG